MTKMVLLVVEESPHFQMKVVDHLKDNPHDFLFLVLSIMVNV